MSTLPSGELLDELSGEEFGALACPVAAFILALATDQLFHGPALPRTSSSTDQSLKSVISPSAIALVVGETIAIPRPYVVSFMA